jgi:sensor histidine kinase regulating citrate/malate metabolism
MSRLLFAAARGARIQSQWRDSLQWQTNNQFVFIDSMRHYRIHPDDEHLQYGPVSTALREMVEDHKYNSSWEHFLANAAANEFTEFFDSRFGEPDYPLFYLILAEALADSGL